MHNNDLNTILPKPFFIKKKGFNPMLTYGIQLGVEGKILNISTFHFFSLI